MRWTWAIAALAVLVAAAEPLLAQEATATVRAYGDFPGVGSRGAVWIAAQVHLRFA
ncbi:MAG: hypothetical protein HY701_03995, partial [Gemmatimonadetes bacterium]|nr:hypothetical protein [Gemmatimonadota bacterium]